MRVLFFFFMIIGSAGDVWGAQEWTQSSEKDYTVRTAGYLSITNPKGNITVQGWTLDKIRIRHIKTIIAETNEEAQSRFSEVEYRYTVQNKQIEISARYGEVLDIQERVKQQRKSKVQQDFIIYAPLNLDLKVWAVHGKILIKSWGRSIEARSQSGGMRFEEIRGSKVLANCTSCPIYMTHVKSSVRCVTQEGEVSLNNVQGASIYVETHQGVIHANHLRGKQTYSTQTGDISGKNLSGNIEFFARDAKVSLQNLNGFLSGYVEKGDIFASIREWDALDQSIIEVGLGNVSLHLPQDFAGELDLWSLSGEVELNFHLQQIEYLEEFGPQPKNHLMGRIREGGKLLKVATKSGKISIKKF